MIINSRKDISDNHFSTRPTMTMENNKPKQRCSKYTIHEECSENHHQIALLYIHFQSFHVIDHDRHNRDIICFVSCRITQTYAI